MQASGGAAWRPQRAPRRCQRAVLPSAGLERSGVRGPRAGVRAARRCECEGPRRRRGGSQEGAPGTVFSSGGATRMWGRNARTVSRGAGGFADARWGRCSSEARRCANHVSARMSAARLGRLLALFCSEIDLRVVHTRGASGGSERVERWWRRLVCNESDGPGVERCRWGGVLLTCLWGLATKRREVAACLLS